MMGIFLLGFFKLVLGGCPKISCGSYSSHLCGKFSEDSIELSPCLDGEMCDISNLYKRWEAGDTGLECIRSKISPNSNSIYELMYKVCSDPTDPGKKLVGAHPKKCESNSDCILMDGSYTECRCGLSMNGYSYCQISQGDDDYIATHKAACSKDIEKFVWYLLRQEFYQYLNDRPICAGFVFEDLAAIDYIYSGGSLLEIISDYSSSSVLALCVILILI
jgi:hypothetical protein